MGAQFSKAPDPPAPGEPPKGYFGARMTGELLDRLVGLEAPPYDLRARAKAAEPAAANAPAPADAREVAQLKELREGIQAAEKEEAARLGTMVAALRDAQTLQRGASRLACGAQRDAVVACYRANADDPFRCHDAVREFMRCSGEATAGARAKAGRPVVGDTSRLADLFPSLGGEGGRR